MISGNIYAGFDRHNSEVFAYYLAMVMNFTWVSPSAIRRIHVNKDVIPVATTSLKKTMVKNGNKLSIILFILEYKYRPINNKLFMQLHKKKPN